MTNPHGAHGKPPAPLPQIGRNFRPLHPGERCAFAYLANEQPGLRKAEWWPAPGGWPTNGLSHPQFTPNVIHIWQSYRDASPTTRLIDSYLDFGLTAGSESMHGSNNGGTNQEQSPLFQEGISGGTPLAFLIRQPAGILIGNGRWRMASPSHRDSGCHSVGAAPAILPHRASGRRRTRPAMRAGSW